MDEVAKIVSEQRAVLDSGELVPNDILTRLLTEKDAEGRQLTEEELSDNLLNLLFAGVCCRENPSGTGDGHCLTCFPTRL